MRPIQILAVVLLFAIVVVGQTNKGGISGTVTDMGLLGPVQLRASGETNQKKNLRTIVSM